MGVFDLDEYVGLKKRADESAQKTRISPRVTASVKWFGTLQPIEFELQPLDGSQVCIAFYPPEQQGEALVVGKVGDYLGTNYLSYNREKASNSQLWLEEASRALEQGLFGRLLVEEEQFGVSHDFYGARGLAFCLWTDSVMDGLAALFSPAYDPKLRARIWCEPREAAPILLRTDETEFRAFLANGAGQNASAIAFSKQWENLSREERHAFVPLCERQMEGEVALLMRAIFWSAPDAHNANLDAQRGRAFWRRPRFCVAPNDSPGTVMLPNAPAQDARLRRLWAHIAPHLGRRIFIGPFDLPPSAAHWMSCGGSYFEQFSHPTRHEHLEARLLLRDFLFERGVSLDELEEQ